eukprot:scaffold14231_cov32-Prasinocladus_malaysianus.AAC.1
MFTLSQVACLHRGRLLSDVPGSYMPQDTLGGSYMTSHPIEDTDAQALVSKAKSRGLTTARMGNNSRCPPLPEPSRHPERSDYAISMSS